MHPIAQAAPVAAASSVGPALLVVAGVIVIWWLSTHGKGSAGYRLIAWLLLPAIVWVLVAVHSPAAAGRIASGAASGAGTAIGAVGRLFSGL